MVVKVNPPKVVEVVPAVQNYDWGMLGSNSLVAKLSGQSSNSIIDEAKPYAEVLVLCYETNKEFFSSGWELTLTLPQKLGQLKVSSFHHYMIILVKVKLVTFNDGFIIACRVAIFI